MKYLCLDLIRLEINTLPATFHSVNIELCTRKYLSFFCLACMEISHLLDVVDYVKSKLSRTLSNIKKKQKKQSLFTTHLLSAKQNQKHVLFFFKPIEPVLIMFCSVY